jgi:predicted acetyltransferase
MTLAEKIFQHVKSLPDTLQAEVLNFVEYLESKAEKNKENVSETDWSTLSLYFAMQGMENEHSSYSLDDLKERFT